MSLRGLLPAATVASISAAEVIGKWKLTHSAPPAAFADDGEAEFLASGQCILHKFAHGDDETSGTYTWRIDVEDHPKASVLHIGGFGTAQHPLTTSFYFTRKHRKLVLWQDIGDPDSRNYIEYERL